jgi:hypothetical protein
VKRSYALRASLAASIAEGGEVDDGQLDAAFARHAEALRRRGIGE